MLIGVFSIIVVMTSMRVLKSNIETEMSQLGANTFAIQKWPELQFEGPSAGKKIRRPPQHSVGARRLVAERRRSPRLWASKRILGWSRWRRVSEVGPGVRTMGRNAGFPAKNWLIADGGALTDSDVDNARDVCAGGRAVKDSFRSVRRWGES